MHLTAQIENTHLLSDRSDHAPNERLWRFEVASTPLSPCPYFPPLSNEKHFFNLFFLDITGNIHYII